MGFLTLAPLALALTFQPTESPSSSELARQLTTVLSSRGLDAIAAADPSEAGRFVAALFVPGSQLLVVAAQSSSPSSELARLTSRQYRDVYLDLQGGPSSDRRVFYQDMNADGLCSAPDQIPDLVYQNDPKPLIIDGRSKGHGIPEKDYETQRMNVEQEYRRLLKVLLAQLNSA